MTENKMPNLDVLDEEFNTGSESAREIPNAQVGEAIAGTHGQDGASEQMGDVGNRTDKEINNQRREDEFINDDSHNG